MLNVQLDHFVGLSKSCKMSNSYEKIGSDTADFAKFGPFLAWASISHGAGQTLTGKRYDIATSADALVHAPGPAEEMAEMVVGKLYRARSRLYRNEILQVNMRLKALLEIYTMHSFAQLCNLDF